MTLKVANQTSFKKGVVPWNKGKKCPGVGGRPKGFTAWNKGLIRTWKSVGFVKGYKPWNTGKYFSGNSGHTHTQEWKENMSKKLTGKKYPNMCKENHPRWIKDRTKLCRRSKQGERRTSIYFNWRKQVWLRDNWKCKIANPDCKGRIEAHHILSYRDYENLRLKRLLICS